MMLAGALPDVGELADGEVGAESLALRQESSERQPQTTNGAMQRNGMQQNGMRQDKERRGRPCMAFLIRPLRRGAP
jgi:hypothetical protein